MDILFFAAIAVYIFVKLREQLGKFDEDEAKQIQEKIIQKQQIISAIQNQIVSEVIAISEEQKKIDDNLTFLLDGTSKEHFFKAIKACNISPEFFLNGAKSAFEMVIKAFSGGDLETLKFLLAEKIYLGFEQSVNARKAAQQTLISNIIAIEKAEIISAYMFASEASVTVRFVSKQINYITDNAGAIIDGRKDEITTLTDTWTFKKDITSTNPNWEIVSTNSN